MSTNHLIKSQWNIFARVSGLRIYGKEVIQRQTIPNDPGEKLNYNADRLTGALITQTFEYTIENGLEGSYATNGERSSFSGFRTTVYYYLAEPNQEADEQEEGFSTSLCRRCPSAWSLSHGEIELQNSFIRGMKNLKMLCTKFHHSKDIKPLWRLRISYHSTLSIHDCLTSSAQELTRSNVKQTLI